MKSNKSGFMANQFRRMLALNQSGIVEEDATRL